MGSKYKLLDRLIPLFPNKKVFVDLFTGGGSVYMNVAHLYETVIANDLLKDLVGIHTSLQQHTFIKEASALSFPTKHSQEAYVSLREQYNKNPSADKLLALIWSCNSNMMRFNQEFKFNQTWGQRCFNANTQKKWDIFSGRNYKNVSFSNVHFNEFTLLYPQDTFVYLDPPYSNTEAGYNAFWSNDDERRIIALIHHYIANGIAFGLSGVINGKPNMLFDALQHQEGLSIHYFDDLYQKISKKDKTNIEYYITNITTPTPPPIKLINHYHTGSLL